MDARAEGDKMEKKVQWLTEIETEPSPAAKRVAYLFDRLEVPGALSELLRLIAARKDVRD